MTGTPIDPQLRDIFDTMLSKQEHDRCQGCVMRSAVVSGDRNIFVFGGTLNIELPALDVCVASRRPTD